MKEKIQEQLRRIEEAENIKILLAVESGSRAWGFASPDSDYDVRFIYIRRLDHYFSSKKTLHHYVSMAEGNYREYLKGDLVRAKKYFYVLRPVLACQLILDRGTPPPMLFSELLKAELPVELIDVVNQLLELKMNSPEVKLINRISEINEYLDESIPSIKSAVRLLDDSHTPDWSELNQLFLRELMK